MSLNIRLQIPLKLASVLRLSLHLPCQRLQVIRASSATHNNNRRRNNNDKVSSKGMEVEVKLTLPDAANHNKLATILAPYHKITHLQENYFFDGPNGELSSRRAVLRLRFYNVSARCVVSLKSQAQLQDGVSRVEELEEDMDVEIGRECVKEPRKLGLVENGIVKKVVAEFGCREFVCLGGFRNARNVSEWEGELLELDETEFEFGKSYELECETPDPERVRAMLEEFLAANGVLFSHSVASKFAVFRSGRLPSL